MKLGKLSKLTNVSFTSSTTPVTGKEAVNMLDNDVLNIYQVVGGENSVLVEFDPITVDAITLHNVVARSTVKIDIYASYPSNLAVSTTIKATNFSGFYIKNTTNDLDGLLSNPASGSILGEFILNEHILGGEIDNTISAIKITFTGPSSTFLSSLGYLWAGDLIDFGCAEKIQPADQSSDDLTISRANHPDVNDKYEYSTYSVTLPKEETINTLRDKIRLILLSGYGTPRPVIFDEPMFPVSETLLGILDASKIGYDIIETDNASKPLIQATIGIREVF